MKWIGLYLVFGVLWMMLEELIAIVHGNEGYWKFLKSVNALELLFVRVISVIIWPIPMTRWFRDLQASKKEPLLGLFSFFAFETFSIMNYVTYD